MCERVCNCESVCVSVCVCVCVPAVIDAVWLLLILFICQADGGERVNQLSLSLFLFFAALSPSQLLFFLSFFPLSHLKRFFPFLSLFLLPSLFPSLVYHLFKIPCLSSHLSVCSSFHMQLCLESR